jgi:hypothetical protein
VRTRDTRQVSTRERYGEVFWREHHEAWQQSSLYQRECCEAHGIPLGLELRVAADVIGTGRGPIFREPCGARSRRSHLNLSELLFGSGDRETLALAAGAAETD